MKVLVTGGAGFIGHHLVAALLARRDDVTVLDDLSTGDIRRLEPLLDRIRFVRGDIRDPGTTRDVTAGADVVLHQAALPSVTRSMLDPRRTNAVNVGGTVELILAAAEAGVPRFVMAGSSSIYGARGPLPRSEDQPPDPRSPYAVSKLAAEHYVHLIGAAHGVETVVLRYFNVFGPGQDPDSEYAAVVPRFTTAALAGRRPLIYGDGTASRDFTYIDNVVHANLLATKAPIAGPVTANIGCGERYSLLDLVTAIARATGAPIEPEHHDPRPGDVPHSQADISAAREALGYVPVVGFTEGIARTVAWYRQVTRDEHPVG
jgi:nucleoside-diphosphate-sugar epimerase